MEVNASMKHFLILVLVAVSATFWPAASAAAVAEPPIKIGVIIPLTGEDAEYGQIQKNSFTMGASEINESGGINGRKLDLVIEDDKSDVKVGWAAADKLISQDQVTILTGGFSSEVTYAVGALAQLKKTPFLVNTAAADNITEQGWNYVFRIATPASEYTNALDSFLKDVVKPKTAMIIHPMSLFGESNSKRFEEKCKKMGIKVLLKEGFQRGLDDFRPLLERAKAANPDVFYVVAQVSDAALLMRQAKTLHFNPKLFVGGGAGFTTQRFADEASDASDNVFTVIPWTQSVTYHGAKKYYDRYVNNFGSHPLYQGAQAYAAMHVIAHALRRAKEPTREAVRDELAATDLMTEFGPVKFISYGKKTQQNSVPAYLAQWQNRKLETVWPRGVAEKQYVYPVPRW
jgi:branched-chain amino acid transport system substrate-binding protein